MIRKTTPLFRVLFVVMALVVSQIETVQAASAPSTLTSAGRATAPAPEDSTDGGPDSVIPPKSGSGLFLPDTPRDECKVRVNTFLLAAPFSGPPVEPPPYGASILTSDPDDLSPRPNPEANGNYVDRKAGDTLTWLTVIENATADPGCSGDEALSDIQVQVAFTSTADGTGLGTVSVPLSFPGTPGVLTHDGDIAWAVFDYIVPSTVNGKLHARTTVAAEAVTNRNNVGIPPNDVADFDDDYVDILGPGFRILSFVPSVTQAAAGDLVDFTLIIQNTRPGSTITGISVSSGSVQFQTACTENPLSSAGHWTSSGAPISTLPSGQQAQCIITGVPIPSDPAPDSYSLAGQVSVTDGNASFDLTLTATSDPVDVTLPDVAISKRVKEIKRGSNTIYTAPGPVPSAAPGDVITYEIVVTNTGDVELRDLWIVDSLTGPVLLPPTTTLPPTPPTNTLTITTSYIVQQGGQDPLTNQATVTAHATGYPNPVDAEATTAVDIIDSALEAVLTVEDPTTGDPVFSVNVGQTVRYRLVLRNKGGTQISGLDYVAVSAPLRTVGTPPTPITPSFLAPDGELALTWTYTILDTDSDPLISTVRVRGSVQGGTLVYGQSQASLDISNPDIGITAVVQEPDSPAVLRGGQVEYLITVTNKDPGVPICSVVVNQLRRDPDTGQEIALILNVPMIWPDPGLPGQLGGGESATAVTTYLVTGADKDPLDMIFEVTATDACPTGGPLSDRTTRTLDISDAQVNAELIPDLGGDGIAEIGDPVQFTFVAQNVGAVTLENLSATWCILHRAGETPPVCDKPFDPGHEVTPTTIGSFENTTGQFTYTIVAGDADANPFVAEVTLYGTDNKGNQVSIKVATTIPVATNNLLLRLSGPENSVIGDTAEFGYTITNNSGADLFNVRLYNMLVPDAGDPYGYQQVGYFDTIPASEENGSNVKTGTFTYVIKPGVGISGDVLVLPGRVLAEYSGGDMLANAAVNVPLVPIISVVKTGDTSAVAGEEVHYTVTITNNSKSQAFTISSYQDSVFELPQYNLPVNNDSFAPWPEDPDTHTSAPGVLPWGTTVTGHFTIPKPPGVDATPNPLVNTFVLSGTREYDGATVTGSASYEVQIACPIDFNFQVFNTDVDENGQSTPQSRDDVLGETLRWRISITNASSATISGITINETLNWNGDVTSQVTWPDASHLGQLGPGQTAFLNEFEKQITNAYYHASGENFMTDSLEAAFSAVAGASSCSEVYQYPVYSPIAILKVPDPFIAFTGETVNYTILLANVTEADDGDYSRYYVTVSDDLLQPNPIPMAYNGAGNPETTAGEMGPGEIIQKVVGREVLPNDPAELTNTVTAEFPDPTDSQFSFYTWAQALVYTGNALQLTKTPSTAKAAAGTTITYDYTITNVSPYQVTDIELIDSLIGNLAPGRTGGTINLDSGASFTSPELIGVPYDIPLDATDPLSNTVTATGMIHLPDGSEREVTSSLTVSVDLEDTDIQITKSARQDNGGNPGDPLPDNFPVSGPDGVPEVDTGTPVFYCFTVENQNTGTATFIENIAIEDTMLPAGALQTPFQDAVTAKYGRTGAESAKLMGQESVDFCYGPVTLSQSMGDPLTNLVSIQGKSSGGFPIYAEDELTIDLIGADILITKLPSPPLVFVGEPVTYTITILNKNGSQNITVDEVLDTFQGGAPVPLPLDQFDWSNSAIGGAPVGQLGHSGGYATYTYEYTVQASDPDPLKNVTTVNGNLNGSPVTDSTSATVAVTASQLLVRKTATPNVARPSPVGCGQPGQPGCQNVSYTISITNIGSVPVYDIIAVDDHYDMASGTHIRRLFQGADLTDSDLAPYETAFIHYELPMPTADQLTAEPSLDPFINTVRVYGVVFDEHGVPIPMRDPDASDPYDDDKSIKTDATATVDILQPNVRITKSPVTQAAAPGQTVSYNVTIANIGGAGETLTQLVFTDVTGSVTVNLDSVCPNADLAVCPFVYGPEPYGDYDSDPGTPDTANPKDGEPYDPADGLASREQLRGTITVQVPVDWAETEFTNVAQISGQAAPAGDPVVDRASATIDIRSEGINVTKVASVSEAPVGTPVTYTVRVQNIGGSAIERLVISDNAIDSDPDHSVTIENGFPDSPEDVVPGDDSETLDPGEEFVYQYIHTLTMSDPDPYVNRVTVAGYTATTTVLNVAQATVDIQSASISVDKFVCAGSDGDGDPSTQPDPCVDVVNVGDANPDVVTYYLHFTNPSPVPLEHITVTDTVGTVGAITWPAANDGLAADDAAPGGNDEMWVMYEYTVGPGDPDPLVNLVTATGQTQAGATVQSTATASLSLVTSDLRLTKSAVDQAAPGENVTYTLTVENLGTSATDITGIQVVDPLSQYGTDPIPGCAATLTAGGTTSCSFTHTVSLADGSPLVNTATASGSQGGIPVTDSASHTLQIVTQGLSVSKVASTQVAGIGQNVTFTYRVENTGAALIDNLVVMDSDPAATFGTCWPNVLTPGQVAVCTWTRTMTAQDPDPYTNTVTATGRIGSQTLRAQASETVYLANGSLVVTNVPNVTYVLDGQPVTFTYTVTNLGTETLTNLAVSDNLCGNLTLTSTTLQPGLSQTVYCTVTAALPGPVVSTVYAQAEEPGPVTVMDTATAEVPVASSTGGLLVVKAADRTTATTQAPNNVITYMITVTNIGTETLNQITVDDPTVVGLSPAPPSSLAVGQSFIMTGTYTVPASSPPPSVTNTATVTATGATSGTVYQDSDSASVAVLENPQAALALTKEPSTQRVRPGDAVTYTFTVRNISAEPASGITLNDPALAETDPPSGVVSIPDLGPGNAATVLRTVHVPPVWNQTTYTNTAQVYLGQELQDTAAATLLVELLELSKTANATASVGEDVDYTFTVTNFSQSQVTNVSLVDPQIQVWDTALPSSIPPSGAVAYGHLTVPLDYANPTVDNTAQLLIGTEVVDTSSASVAITRTGLVVELVRITQTDGGHTLTVPDLMQTGEPIEVTVRLRNTGAVTIDNPAYTVGVDIPGVTCQHIGTALPGTLAPAGQTGDSVTATCSFTAPVALATYRQTNGLTRTLDISATGTASSDTVEATATGTLTLVDLQLGVELIITPATAVEPGDSVTFALRLTNTGASPIGCGSAVAAGEPCHLSFTMQSSPDLASLNSAVISALESQISNQVLDPGAVFTTPTPYTYTVASTDQTTTFTVIVDGGYFSQTLVGPPSLLGYYLLLPPGATDDAQMIVALPEITLALTVTPNPTVYSQSVTYGVTVTNTGTVNVTGLVVTYQINPLAAAPGVTGMMLVSGDLKPALQATSGTISLNRTALAPGESAQGFLAKIEDQTRSYVFITTAVGQAGEPAVQVSDQADVTLTPITAGQITPTPTVDLSTLNPNAVDPIVEKTPSAEQAERGSPVTWTVTVRNGGTQVMSNVTVQDAVPDTLTLVSASADRGATIVDGQLVTLSTGQMNPGDTVTVTLNTTVAASAASPSSITNTACAARDGGPQVCSTGTVNVGPSAGQLPETGVGSPSGASQRPVGGLAGVALASALMILMAAQVSQRRMKIAVIFMVVAVAIIIVAVVLLAARGGEKSASERAQGTASATALSAASVSTPEATEATATTAEAVAMQFPPTPTPYVLPTPAGPRYLLIPKLADQFKAPIPIVETPLINRKWDVSGLGYYVGWLQGTTWMDPGWGNTVLAAHVQLGFQNPGPFWGLGDLVPGDEIIVIEGDIQRKFVVKSIRKVDPSDLSVTAPTNSPTLTLITCTEWNSHYGLFSQRMVVQAVPENQS
jgi:LPXTG-site transpeptidase (sortase) family protein